MDRLDSLQLVRNRVSGKCRVSNGYFENTWVSGFLEAAVNSRLSLRRKKNAFCGGYIHPSVPLSVCSPVA